MEQSKQPNSKRRILIFIALIVLLFAGAGIFALQQNQTDDAQTSNSAKNITTDVVPDTIVKSTPDTTNVASAPSEQMIITFTDEGFTPNEVTVKAGTTILVMNKSTKKVQFSSDEHPAHKDNEEMNLSTISPNSSELYTASKVGTWGFHDHIDESKTGTVTVTE